MIDAIELARLLTDNGRIVYRAVGACMFPAIRPGDLLTVELRRPEDVRPGDVALVRRNDRLLGHRVTAAGADAGRHYVVTRPDRASHDDGRTFAEDLLGVVAMITRRGKHLQVPPPPSGARPLWERFQLARLEVTAFGGRALLDLHEALTRTRAYRTAARRVLSARLANAVVEIRTPLVEGGFPSLGRSCPVEQADLAELATVGRFFLDLRLGGGRLPAASALLTATRESGDALRWRLADLTVRHRFRGCGLEERVGTTLNQMLGETFEHV